jgi:predicted cupin superfamily sugar epimerase
MSVVGVVIVAGFGFLGYEVYNRAAHPERAVQTRSADLSVESAASDGGNAGLQSGVTLPAGATIGEIVPAGTRVVVRVVMPDGSNALYILNPASGELSRAVSEVSAP